MNLIDYNQAIEALEKERQLLLNREQYGAENVLVHHALNVIAELPVIRQPQIVRCKDCKHRPIKPCENGFDLEFPDEKCPCQCDDGWCSWYPPDDWFCAGGEKKGQ